MGDQLLPHRRTVYQRAHARREIDLERIPPAVLAILFDLVRHDMLMDLKSLEPERIQSIVDDLFVPLVRHASKAERDRRGAHQPQLRRSRERSGVAGMGPAA